MKKYLSTFLLGSTLVLAACGGGDDATDNDSDNADSGDAQAGEQIAKDNCASCHGSDFTGASGPALAGTDLSKDEFADTVKNGKGQMPAFESLSDDEIDDLYDYFQE